MFIWNMPPHVRIWRFYAGVPFTLAMGMVMGFVIGREVGSKGSTAMLALITGFSMFFVLMLVSIVLFIVCGVKESKYKRRLLIEEAKQELLAAMPRASDEPPRQT